MNRYAFKFNFMDYCFKFTRSMFFQKLPPYGCHDSGQRQRSRITNEARKRYLKRLALTPLMATILLWQHALIIFYVHKLLVCNLGITYVLPFHNTHAPSATYQANGKKRPLYFVLHTKLTPSHSKLKICLESP